MATSQLGDDDRDDSHLRSECWSTSEKVFSTHTVDTFATCGFNVRMRKYAQCGPRLTATCLELVSPLKWVRS